MMSSNAGDFGSLLLDTQPASIRHDHICALLLDRVVHCPGIHDVWDIWTANTQEPTIQGRLAGLTSMRLLLFASISRIVFCSPIVRCDSWRCPRAWVTYPAEAEIYKNQYHPAYGSQPKLSSKLQSPRAYLTRHGDAVDIAWCQACSTSETNDGGQRRDIADSSAMRALVVLRLFKLGRLLKIFKFVRSVEGVSQQVCYGFRCTSKGVSSTVL